MRFGDLVARARKEKRLTLRRLCEAVGKSPGVWSEIEHGRRMPPQDRGLLEKLAQALGVEADELEAAAQTERSRRQSNFSKFFDADPDLAMSFTRATEEAEPDQLREIMRQVLADLNDQNKGG